MGQESALLALFFPFKNETKKVAHMQTPKTSETEGPKSGEEGIRTRRRAKSPTRTLKKRGLPSSSSMGEIDRSISLSLAPSVSEENFVSAAGVVGLV